MKFEQFETVVDGFREGCMNRLADMEESSAIEEYNWYAETHNEITGTFMALQTEYYDDETSND